MLHATSSYGLCERVHRCRTPRNNSLPATRQCEAAGGVSSRQVIIGARCHLPIVANFHRVTGPAAFLPTVGNLSPSFERRPESVSSVRPRARLLTEQELPRRPPCGGSHVDPERWWGALFDHFVGAQQNRLRQRNAECLGGSQIDHQLELGGLLDRQIPRLCSAQNPANIIRKYPIDFFGT
jgi:hypothetical protein